MKKQLSALWLVALLLTLPFLHLSSADLSQETPVRWDSYNTGNVWVPGYFADPSILYDQASDAFYMYATSDGMWISYSRDPHVAVSKDLINWTFHPIALPDYYPICTAEAPNANKAGVWAPTVFKHPRNGFYYLGYQVNLEFYVLMSDTPIGPWRNATRGTTADDAPILKNKQQWGQGDAFDCQFFVDTDSEVYITFGGHRHCGICKTRFDEQGYISVDNSDERFDQGTTVRYKKIEGLPEYIEGSVLTRVGDTYYLSYSCGAAQTYRVRYAVGTSPVGPFVPAEGYVVQSDRKENILGPGHHDIFSYKGDWYILYHRQHFPLIDAKRQVCIDKVEIGGGKMSTDVQSHAGLSRGEGELEKRYQAAAKKQRPSLALGKPALASGVSNYKGGVNYRETFEGIPHFFKADYAFDANWGTRWQSDKEVGEPAWIIVDLEKEQTIRETEVWFEYTIRPYTYTVTYLSGKQADNLEEAARSTSWKPYGGGSSKSPATDSKKVKARFIKLSITDVTLPQGEEYRGCGGQDYERRPSVWEFNVYETLK